jgi:uncharacterized membrane protein YphA (DoxX/SURF4 family)
MVLHSALAVTGLAGSIGVGLIFLTAGIEKQRNRAILPGVISNYRLLPDALVGPVAIALPFVEIALGLMLLVGLSPIPVLLAITLLLLFAAAMAINVARGRAHISCGCGRSELKHGLSWGLVMRNLGLATLLAVRLLPTTPFALMDLITAAAAGIGFYIAYVLLTSIGALVAAPAFASRR